MRVLGIPVVHRAPVEPRADVARNLIHQLAGAHLAILGNALLLLFGWMTALQRKPRAAPPAPSIQFVEIVDVGIYRVNRYHDGARSDEAEVPRQQRVVELVS